MTRRKNDQVEEIARRPYTVELEYGDSPAEGVLAYLAEWPDAFAAGPTRENAVAELGHVIRDLAAYRLQRGLDIPEPIGRFSGKILLRMPRKLHQDAERRATAEGVSLNTWLTSAVARELGPAVERRRKHSRRVPDRRGRARPPPGPLPRTPQRSPKGRTRLRASRDPR